MKKVIFICLLSLSVCLSKPSEPAKAPEDGDHAAKDQRAPASSTVASPTPDAHPATGITSSNPEPPKQEQTSTPAAPTAKPDEHNNIPKQEEAPKIAGDKEKPSTTVVPHSDATTKADNKTTQAPTPQTSPATPDAHDKKATSTEKPAAPTTHTDVPSKIVQARGFDGASFIGGIILTLGLLAIGFMGFKYYKNQTERNYHTL